MDKIIVIGICTLLLVCVSCDNKVRETQSGLTFQVIKDGDGILPKSNEVVIFNFKLIDSNDSVWNDTYRSGLPRASLVRDTSSIQYENGLKQMLREVSKGDSIHVHFTVKSYYKDVVRRPIPTGVDSALNLVYRVSIDSIMPIDVYRSWIQAIFAQKRDEQIRKDGIQIDQYLKENGINAMLDSSGLRYVISKWGYGPTGKSKQAALVWYSGYFLNGSCFVTNIKELAVQEGIYSANKEYEPLEVIIDETSVIAAWHVALKLLNNGAQGTFYIPSSLAYGQQGQGKIGENEVLIFKIEVLDIR